MNIPYYASFLNQYCSTDPLKILFQQHRSKPAVISALASGLLYLSNPTLAARVSTCAHRSLRIACGGGRQGLLIATRLQALLQPSVDRRLERRVAGHPVGLVGMIEGIRNSRGA
jgi:1,6-anhydro-N-acetylmuramate kinase